MLPNKIVMHKSKLILVEDHPAIVKGLTIHLNENFPYFDITSCHNAEIAISQLNNKEFEFAIIDLGLPLINGIEIVKFIKANNLKTKIIIYTFECKREVFKDLKNLKVEGIILKGDDMMVFKDCFEAISNGKTFYSESIVAEKPNDPLELLRSKLSKAQFEVFELLIELKKPQEIADKLNKSINTIQTHIKDIYAFFDVHNYTEFLREIRKRGLF